MKMPKNYANTQVGGSFTPVELGGHYAIIKQVKEQKAKNGKDMITVVIDFDKNDIQPGYFSKAFADDVRPEKKWPYNGVKYVMVEAYDSDECSKDFKGFCEAAEKSNSMVINWDSDFGSQFKNRKIGVVFGLVENEYNGKVTTRPEIRWFCPIDKVADAKVPNLKELRGKSTTLTNTSQFTASFDNPPADEDLPF